MTDFHKFATTINDRFKAMAKEGELFVLDQDDIFDIYLAAFPAGANPLFKTRTEFDCSCCRNFVKNIGNVVSIKNNTIQTVWDVTGLEYPFNEVASVMDSYLRTKLVKSVFRTSESKFGAVKTVALIDGATMQWNHFFCDVPKEFKTATPDAVRGEKNTTAAVLKRGLEELALSDLNTVLDLIESNELYRGAEHKKAVTSFRDMVRDYGLLNSEDAKALFVWSNVNGDAVRFRNTAIGTLVQDLSSGLELEQAVHKFEAMVAPQNYKRPTALITQKMITDAVKKLDELGLEDAVSRRYANLSDVSVNDVLFTDNSVKPVMKHGGAIADLLMAEVKPVKIDIKNATEITMDEFLATVVPKASSIELLLENRHLTNFMSLTTAVNPDCGPLFKWNNNFAWSYDGDVADSLRQRVAAAGGRVDGALRFSHTWNYDLKNQSLMDLHVFMPGYSSWEHKEGDNEVHDKYPSTRRVGWNRRQDTLSGGIQDVDYVDPPGTTVPVENISFPSINKMPEGTYVFKIHNWSFRSVTTSGFKAEIEFGGQIFHYEYPKALKNKQWITLAEVTLKNGMFTIKHKLKPSNSSQEKWNLSTETLVPLDTFMTSPNFWSGSEIGNKHWFFFPKGCKNPGQARGFFNEYLKSSLDQHRKVFEVLASKTKCEYVENQLSGIGFSSTRNDTATVVVKGSKINKAYKIVF